MRASTASSQRVNHFQQVPTSPRQRARIFGEQSTSKENRVSSPVSIIPVSNQEVVNAPFDESFPRGLKQSQVSEVQLNDLRQSSKSGFPELSRCKIKFLKKEARETQTEPDDRDMIIEEQRMLIQQLQRQLEAQQHRSLEFSFHRQESQKEKENCMHFPSATSTQQWQPANSSQTQSQTQTQGQTSSQGGYFEIIPKNKAFILRPQNTEKLLEEYINQRSNKDYFFSQM